MEKLIKAGAGLIAAFTVFLGSVWYLDFAQIMDAQPIIDWMNVSKDTLLSVGGSGIAGTIIAVAAKATISSITDKNKAEITRMVNKVYAELEIVKEQNELILEYNKLRAEMTATGRVATEEQKSQMIQWMKKLDPSLVEKVLDFIPDELENKATDIVMEKADELLTLVKGRL